MVTRHLLSIGMRWALGLVAVLMMMPRSVLAQTHQTNDSPIPDELVFEGSTSIAWVMVPTVVRGEGAERPLAVSDFLVEVDEQPVEPVDFFSSFDEPSTLLLFQDLSGSMANGGKLETSRRAIRCLLDDARDGDEMAVVTFASGSTLVDVPITSELAVIEELIDSWQPYGTTALHDAVTWIPQVRLGARSRAAAVLVTDGVDNASVLTPEAARKMVLSAEVPVYVLALRSRRATRRAEGVPTEEEFTRYSKVLRQLAASTGGRYLEITQPSQADAACAAVSGDLKSRYLLSFPLATEGDERERSIRVWLPNHPLSVRHRASYVGRPPA